MGKADETNAADKSKADPKAKPDAIETKPIARVDPDENGTAKVSLSVYLKQRNIPADQAAGFTLYAKQKEISSKTPEQWRQLQDIFNKRPI